MAPVVNYLFLLVLISHFLCSAKSQLQDPSLQTRTGYELIKDLNLLPKLDVNIVKPNTSDSISTTNSRIVEKPLWLQVLGESGASIYDLAHLAGYIQINNTIGGRYICYHHNTYKFLKEF